MHMKLYTIAEHKPAFSPSLTLFQSSGDVLVHPIPHAHLQRLSIILSLIACFSLPLLVIPVDLSALPGAYSNLMSDSVVHAKLSFPLRIHTVFMRCNVGK